MKNKIEDFKEEITENFSELFIETFFIRYVGSKDDLIKDLEDTMHILNRKIDKKINKKLHKLGLKSNKKGA